MWRDGVGWVAGDTLSWKASAMNARQAMVGFAGAVLGVVPCCRAVDPAGPPAAAEHAASPPSARPPVSPAAPVSPAVSASPPTVDAPAAPPADVVSVRFVCDRKYVEATPCDEARWMAAAALAPSTGDLLRHDHGGPMGALWNGDGPMVVLVTAPGAHTAAFGRAKLTGVESAGATWFRVPRATWARELEGVAGKPYRRAAVFVDGKPVGEVWRAEGE